MASYVEHCLTRSYIYNRPEEFLNDLSSPSYREKRAKENRSIACVECEAYQDDSNLKIIVCSPTNTAVNVRCRRIKKV